MPTGRTSISATCAPGAASPPHSNATHRTSVSIQPDEDPFSPTSNSHYHTLSSSENEAGEEDDWTRVSQDSVGECEGERGGGAAASLAPPERVIRKSPSFLKVLWDKRLSRSSSVPSLKSKISDPILKTEPPRIAPLRSRASLLSFGDATATLNVHRVEEEEDAREHRYEQRVKSDWLAPPPFASRASETMALEAFSTTRRHDSLPSVPALRQTVRPGANRLRKPNRLAKSASFDVGVLPRHSATRSSTLIGGAKTSLSGYADSMVRANQPIDHVEQRERALAITTDAPVRFIEPDHSISLGSSSTGTPSLSSSHDPTTQSTMGSSIVSRRSGPSEPRSNGGDGPTQDEPSSIASCSSGLVRRKPALPIADKKYRRSSIVKTIVSRFVGIDRDRDAVRDEHNTWHVQEIVRKHAEDFVERRDTLETKLSTLDSKVSMLLSESEEWRDGAAVLKAFSDKLSKESQVLRSRLDMERRETMRLTNIIEEERAYQHELEHCIEAIEYSREQALFELSRSQEALRALEDRLFPPMNQEYKGPTADNSPTLNVRDRLESTDLNSRLRRPSSAHSLRNDSPSREVAYTFLHLDSVREEEALYGEGPASHETRPSSYSPSVPVEDLTIIQGPHCCPHPDTSVSSTTSFTSFMPKPLTLTPPVTPETGVDSPPFPFVTPRTSHRRTVSHQYSLASSTKSSPDSRTARARTRRSQSVDSAQPHADDSDYADAQSFVSTTLDDVVDELNDVDSSGALARHRRCDEDDWEGGGSGRARRSGPRRQPARQTDSFGIDAPAVGLFTRTGSMRGRQL